MTDHLDRDRRQSDFIKVGFFSLFPLAFRKFPWVFFNFLDFGFRFLSFWLCLPGLNQPRPEAEGDLGRGDKFFFYFITFSRFSRIEGPLSSNLWLPFAMRSIMASLWSPLPPIYSYHWSNGYWLEMIRPRLFQRRSNSSNIASLTSSFAFKRLKSSSPIREPLHKRWVICYN